VEISKCCFRDFWWVFRWPTCWCGPLAGGTRYQGPWAPGTEEWKRAAKKAKKAVEEDRPKDEIDELLEEVMRELEEGVEGAAAGDVLHL
jgi:hypothetical protein